MSAQEEDIGTTPSPNRDSESVYTKSSFRMLGGVKRWKPHALPQALNIDGKHVWEPPIFAYNDLIGENYEKKREAVLKYTKGDRARATDILDSDIEYDFLSIYSNWLEENIVAARDSDAERASFFVQLFVTLNEDFDEVGKEIWKRRILQKRNADGTWKIWHEDDPHYDRDGNSISTRKSSEAPDEEGYTSQGSEEQAFSQPVSEPDAQTDDEEHGAGQDISHSRPLVTETTPLLTTRDSEEQSRHRLGRTMCCCIIQ